MAKGQFHSEHQKGIIKRYYENKDDISTQKLGEVVSDLYVETSPAKVKRLWASAATALRNRGVAAETVDKIVASQDLGALAKIVEKLF